MKIDARERSPAAGREAAAAGRVDQLGPDQEARADEGRVLEHMEPRVAERSVVGGRDVPGGERGDPDAHGDHRAIEHRAHG